MKTTKDKESFLSEYEYFAECIVEENPLLEDDYISVKKEANTKDYVNTLLPDGYNLIINRLDEIEYLIKNKVAQKADISQSKDEIIQEQKLRLEETKSYLNTLLTVLDKKSTPRIFGILSFIGLSISLAFLVLSFFIGEIILNKVHFTFLTFGFILMFIMARLSLKMHYERDV